MKHDDLVTSLDFNEDGRYLISGSFDNTARVWEAVSGQEVARMTHDSFVLIVNFLFDENKVVSRTATNFAWIWDWTARKNNVIMDQGSLIPALAFSPTGDHLISGSYDSIARTWNVSNGEEMAQKEHDFYVESVAFSSINEYVLSAGGNTVYVWDPQTGEEFSHVSRNGQVRVLALSPDDSMFASGVCEELDQNNFCAHGVAYISETLTGKDFAKLTHKAGVYSLAFSPDGSLLASGGCDERGSNGICRNGSTRIMDTNTGIEVASITHGSTVRAVEFTSDGRYLISGSEDRTASVWDVSVGKELFRFTHGDIRTLAISPDGKLAATAGCDQRDDIDRQCLEGSVRIWEVSTGNEISTMLHDNQVNSVAFSPDGRYLISGSWDKSARVWETMTGKEVSRVEHDGGVLVVAFDPSGKYAASGGEDGLIRLWIWNPEDLIQEACSRVTRNLTKTEWDQYIGSAKPFEAVCPNLPVVPETPGSP
jgi:WD40 repeat protein